MAEAPADPSVLEMAAGPEVLAMAAGPSVLAMAAAEVVTDSETTPGETMVHPVPAPGRVAAEQQHSFEREAQAEMRTADFMRRDFFQMRVSLCI